MRPSRMARGDLLLGQDEIRHQLFGLLMHAFGVVIRAGQNDDHIELGKYGDLVSAIPRHKVGGIGMRAGPKRLQPPEITVVGDVVDLRVRRRRFLDPRFRDNLFPVPRAAIEIKLTELEQVAAAQLQAATALGEAERRVGPLRLLNPERRK